jgi:serine/threonine protein kinase
MNELRKRQALSVREFAELADVSPHTAARFFRGKRVQWRKARKLFDSLGIADMRTFLKSDDRDGQTLEDLDASILAEWRIENVASQTVTLSNGLAFRICKLAHSVLPDTFGRGKCYDLTNLRTQDERRVQEQLLRHPTVCRAMAACPRFPANERVLYSDDRRRFWVIDRWFDGITLADKLRYGPLAPDLLPRVMRQILEGLAELHAHQIIRRELSPHYVWLVEPQADVLLKELELAKLLEGVISVSSTWQEDPYRAPEVDGGEIDATVDFYSWAQILVHAVTGRIPPMPADPQCLAGTSLPAAVIGIAQRCLSPSHRWRPQSAAEILRALAAWTD